MDLLHWNFNDTFTAPEAAALILGYDPTEPNYEKQGKIRIVLNRMNTKYSEILEELYEVLRN